ncbi:MAG: hypothetical protein HW405_109 [Candidatus Berkelbacteria bacterium]|nr:hypothetical protein [Candidatus Berkelbacteria bacterium]
MSGHSKWSQIKRQKGAADVKRGAVFSKLTNTIILAAKKGSDPNSNFTLKMAIEKARSANMPKENIDRAVKRGTGELGEQSIEEFLFEALGPSNIGILVEGATDNKNRTISEIRGILNKYRGKLAGSGAVTYMFDRMGKIIIGLSGKNREDIELKIIDSGVQDYQDEQDVLVSYTDPAKLEKIKEILEEENLEVKEAGLSWEPKNTIEISQEAGQKILNLLEELENIDGVTGVYPNFDISTNLDINIKNPSNDLRAKETP